MTDLSAITHAKWSGIQLSKNQLLFERINAAEADFAILKSEHYRELIRVAADGRIARSAADTAKAILADLFEKCPAAVDVYFQIVRKREKEKQNAE